MAMLKGIKNLYYALLTSDDVSGVAYGTPVKIAGVSKLNINRKFSEDTFYAEDGPIDNAYGMDAYDVELTVANLPLSVYNILMGVTQVGAEGRVYNSDTPPYIALGFQATKSNGGARYYWLLKGRFAPPSEDNESAGAQVKLKPTTIKGSFIAQTYDGMKERILDTDDSNYTADMGAAWFNTVLPAGDTTAPTVTCVPADAATGVSTAATVALTFSKAMMISSLVIGESFILQKADGTNVAGTGAWNAAHTVYTFTPGSALSAATGYNAIITKAVKDVSGNKLAAVNTFNFTTA